MWIPRWAIVLGVICLALSAVANYHNFKEGLTAIGQDLSTIRKVF